MATMKSLCAIGADINYSNGVFTINPMDLKKNRTLDCGESGSTMRFLVPVAAALGADATFVGSGKLPQRPMKDLCIALQEHGVQITRPADGLELPLQCSGTLTAGHYTLPGDISSQYITGLLFALPLLNADSTIEVTGNLTSASYIDMTIDALRIAGIKVGRHGSTFNIKGNQHYNMPAEVVIEGDWSSAAFWLVAGVVGKHPIKLRGMNIDTLQGDSAIIEHLSKMGAHIVVDEKYITAMPSQLHGVELNCMDTPDLLPILSVAAAAANGSTIFLNVGRLMYKESDRLEAMRSVLAAVGITSIVGDDTFTVLGGKRVVKTAIDSYGDHRIAMSAAILSTITDGEIAIIGADSVAKSYPTFFDEIIALGGNVKKL